MIHIGKSIDFVMSYFLLNIYRRKIMRYKEIEQGFLDSIKENDPYQFSKQQQIKRWTVLYWSLLEAGGERILKFISQALSSKDSWDVKKDTSENIIDVILNREKVARKLLELESKDGTKFPLDSDDRYHIACWNCFEDKIKEIFEEFRKEYNLDFSEESTKKLIRIKSKRPLTTFWSNFINKDVLSIQDNDKYSYEYGLERAKAEGCIEAVMFFWDKLPEDKKTSERLMDIALYQSVTRYASLDMIRFCLINLSKMDKKEELYKEVLKKDFEKNGYYRILNTSIENYYFNDIKKLFGYLVPQKDSSQPVNPGELSCEEYNTLMFGILDEINSISDKTSINQAYELIEFMYHKEGFESHKKSFVDEVGHYNSPKRNRIIKIIHSNKDIEINGVNILKRILSDISSEKIKLMAIGDEWSANYLLQNKLFSLESLKQLMSVMNENTGDDGNHAVNEEFKRNLPDIISSMENK